jgi:molybdopterin-guanine dinucleotide biosynthesis protein A
MCRTFRYRFASAWRTPCLRKAPKSPWSPRPRTMARRLRPQPVFCLLRAELRDSLARFMAAGGRKIDTWTGQRRQVIVPFDAADDDPRAFANANTLAELRRLEQHP